MSVLLPFFAIIVLGSIVQSISGMGFGLVTVPIFVALYGPIEGVLWGNVVGMITALTLMVQKRENIDWGIAGRFSLASVPAIVITVLAMRQLESASLDLYVGGLMLVMVTFGLVAPKLPEANGKIYDYITGFVGGFLSASVAQSGPAMTAYAQATRWNQLKFAATLQPYFLAMNVVNIPLKMTVSIDRASSTLSIPTLLIGAMGIAAGTLLAKRLIAFVSAQTARKFAMAVAFVGATLVLFRGLTALI
ncbi:MAG: sulfite exporter TauE/SafE family protein [Actinomycetaceae bacterium]|nr:sulfite exporter TauE/SafE family protein [Actinomycetaceae bacterium]